MPSGFPILVVSEDPMLADTLNQASQWCFPEATFIQVYSAAQAKTCFKNLTDFTVRLVILAINEHHSIDELEFLAYLRAHAETQHLPIFLLTTSQLPCDLIASYTSYAATLTFEPFSFNDWVMYVNNLAQYSKRQ